MNRRAGYVLTAALLLICAGCHKGEYPYRRSDKTVAENPNGTPADRTGGAANVPDQAGGGPGTHNQSPADQPAH